MATKLAAGEAKIRIHVDNKPEKVFVYRYFSLQSIV